MINPASIREIVEDLYNQGGLKRSITESRDGDQYFDPSALASAASQNSKSRSILIYMDPQDFLTVAEGRKSVDTWKRDRVSSSMKAGVKWDDIPTISFKHDGKGVAYVTGHEGRHRADALIEAGVSSMPVLLTSEGSREGDAIRWGQQGIPDSFDRIDQKWPEVLKQENGGSGSIPFPISDMRGGDLKESFHAYHGSGTDFDTFSYDFTGQGNDQIGSGFYFTTSPDEARAYTRSRIQSDTPKLGGEGSPTVMEVELDIKKPLDADAVVPLSSLQMRKLLMLSPNFEESLQNWGDVEYEGREKVIGAAVKAYVQGTKGQPLVRGLFAVANDFYDRDTKAFNDAVTKVLGYDGVVQHFPATQHADEKTHYVAFRPEQVRVIRKTRV
jgi:hypothetical protein